MRSRAWMLLSLGALAAAGCGPDKAGVKTQGAVEVADDGAQPDAAAVAGSEEGTPTDGGVEETSTEDGGGVVTTGNTTGTGAATAGPGVGTEESTESDGAGTEESTESDGAGDTSAPL